MAAGALPPAAAAAVAVVTLLMTLTAVPVPPAPPAAAVRTAWMLMGCVGRENLIPWLVATVVALAWRAVTEVEEEGGRWMDITWPPGGRGLVTEATGTTKGRPAPPLAAVTTAFAGEAATMGVVVTAVAATAEEEGYLTPGEPWVRTLWRIGVELDMDDAGDEDEDVDENEYVAEAVEAVAVVVAAVAPPPAPGSVNSSLVSMSRMLSSREGSSSKIGGAG